MIASVIDAMFGCWHSHYSFPITVPSGKRRSGAAQATGTYVVCLDCGKELSYDWQRMKVVSGREAVRIRARALAAKEAA